jgi:uncharacterized OB-fold protein
MTPASSLGLVPNVSAPQYLEGLASGHLVLPHCGRCGATRLPWIVICPNGHDHPTEWRPASGAGTLWTWAIYHRQYPIVRTMAAPYVIVQVQLPEGVRLNAHLVDTSSENASPPHFSLRHGLPMTFTPVETDGRYYPGFAVAR